MGSALLLLPPLLRVLPDRYAYYLPEPLQALRRQPHPDTLPTPAIAVSPMGWLPLSPTPMPSPTLTPSPMPTPLPTPTPSPTPVPTPTLPPSLILAGFRHEYQRWNNCGPATLAMGLSYFGRSETQREIASVLRPDPEDKNVSPEEMAEYVRSLGLGARVVAGGTLERLKHLLRAGFPVIVETWYVRDARDQLGHYRLLIGYDNTKGAFITHDSLDGPSRSIRYDKLDELWRVFNRVYLVLYSPDREDEVLAILGEDADEERMWERALSTAYEEIAAPPVTCVAYARCSDWVTFGWFNVGTNLNALGRFEEAAAAYDQSRRLNLHYRMLWYQFGPYEAYYAAGRYEDVIALANATLATASNLEESYYWRGMARLAQGDTRGARRDLEKALRYHPGWPPAQDALTKVEEMEKK